MNFDDNTVYVLDSYGLIYRCYFAFIKRPLINKNGDNVSALFGFFRNLHYVLEHYKPGCLVAAMDSSKKTFRHELYSDYKATRDKAPEDLHAQIPWIDEVLEALGIPVIKCDGYEADDIIATIAKKCEAQGRTCRILSGDKDLMQLVTDSTQILKPEAGSTWKVTGIEGVEAEWGVKPKQLLDLLALYGDTADNIPGVKGVGVKTASKLLTQYNNLDGIYNHIDEIKGAIKTKLVDGKENAYFSQKLVRLCEEVPCTDIDKVLSQKKYEFDYIKASKVLYSYDVSAVAKQYEALALSFSPKKINDIKKTINSPMEVTINKGNYKAVTSIDELKNFIDKAIENKTVAYDSETDSLDTITTNIIGFSLSYKKGEAIYVPLQKQSTDLFSINDNYLTKDEAFKELERLFTTQNINVIFHNAKFDLKVLYTNGLFNSLINKNSNNRPVDFISCFKANIQDTMIIAWILTPDKPTKNGYSLEYLGETVLGLKGINFKDIVSKGMTFNDVSLEKAVPYASEDADFTYQLWTKFEKELKETPSLWTIYSNIEMKILPVLMSMELNGIHLDPNTLLSYNTELLSKLENVKQDIYKEVGHEFNIASPKQLQEVLFEERNLTPGKKTKTGYSTDTSVLEDLIYEDVVPKMILDYRELSKLQSTYVEPLPSLIKNDKRIHTDFVQTGTATGRLSCRDPNLQNIPIKSEAGRKIRSAFTAPEGKVLISADYAQIELVIFAHLSNDEQLCKAFKEGTDVHKATASLIFNVSEDEVTSEMRRVAKVINFGVIYGMSPFRLSKSLGISRKDATAYINNYFTVHSSVTSFINEIISEAEQKGYVETILGRRRPVLNINSRNKVEKNAAERVAVNSPVQGSAADLVKIAMINIYEKLKQENSPAKLLLQVHDELIFECPDDKETIDKTIAIIKDTMENAVKLNVPLRVSIEYGKNWGEFH